MSRQSFPDRSRHALSNGHLDGPFTCSHDQLPADPGPKSAGFCQNPSRFAQENFPMSRQSFPDRSRQALPNPHPVDPFPCFLHIAGVDKTQNLQIFAKPVAIRPGTLSNVETTFSR